LTSHVKAWEETAPKTIMRTILIIKFSRVKTA
jgi:hypothetical protein